MDTALSPIPAYIINLRKRTDRKQNVLNEFQRKDEFDCTMVEAVEDEVGAFGLWKTIMGIAENIPANTKYILICEDDHMFTDSYDKNGLLTAIGEAEQANADILLGGVSWFQDAIFVSKRLMKVRVFTGAQFMVVFKRAFERIRCADFHSHDVVDRKFSKMFDNIFLVLPIISVQKDYGYSDATNKNNVPGRIDELFNRSSASLKIIERMNNYYAGLVRPDALDIDYGVELDGISIPTYVINLKERPERLDHIKKQFSGRREFDVSIVEGVKHKIGAVGLWMSIRAIVQLAVENDDDVIIICEDDHSFTEMYSRDLLMKNVIVAHKLGAEYVSGGCSDFEHPVPVTENLYWVAKFSATQFIILYRSAFKKILDEPYNDDVKADEFLSELIVGKMIFYPGISVQKDFGYSDVTALHNENKLLVTEMFERAKVRLDWIHNTQQKSVGHKSDY